MKTLCFVYATAKYRITKAYCGRYLSLGSNKCMSLCLAILSHTTALCRYQVRSEQDERRPSVHLNQLDIWASEASRRRILDVVLAGTVPREPIGTSTIFANLSSLGISRPIPLLQECSADIDITPVIYRWTTMPLILLFLPFLTRYI
jgi:hypothetical protein